MCWVHCVWHAPRLRAVAIVGGALISAAPLLAKRQQRPIFLKEVAAAGWSTGTFVWAAPVAASATGGVSTTAGTTAAASLSRTTVKQDVSPQNPTSNALRGTSTVCSSQCNPPPVAPTGGVHVTCMPRPCSFSGVPASSTFSHGPRVPPMHARDPQLSKLSPTQYVLPLGQVHWPPQPPTLGFLR